MTYRLFEGKDHASIYQKYRFTPPDEVKNIILQYLDKKVCHGQIYCEYTVHSVFTAHMGPFDRLFCLWCKNIQYIDNKYCMSVNVLRRDSHMCSQWIWDVGRVSIPGYWHHTSRKWWASTSVSVNWKRPELCQVTLTSHTGRGVWVALYVWTWLEVFGVISVTCLVHLQEGDSRGASFSRWLCRVADSSVSSPLVW